MVTPAGSSSEMPASTPGPATASRAAGCVPAASVVHKAPRDATSLVPDLWFRFTHGESVALGLTVELRQMESIAGDSLRIGVILGHLPMGEAHRIPPWARIP